nr:unnamed protein product [Callosobruchus chinensis]
MCVERTKKWLQCIVLVISIEQSVSGIPLVIKAGSAMQQNHQQHQDTKGYNGAIVKGIANYEGDEGFNHDLHKMYQDMSNTGRYGEHRGIVKNSLDQNQFNRDTVQQNGGGLITDIENKRAHKKGHHNSGFRNTYHKDETGSNSSFFDDGGDEGDEYVRKAQHGQYGDILQANQRGSNLASKNYANNAAEQSSYDKGQHGSQEQGRKGNFGRNQYYDDKEHANAANAAKAYGEAGRYDQEQYAVKPYPVYPVLPAPHPLPHPPVLVHHPLPVQDAVGPPVAPQLAPLPPPSLPHQGSRKITIYEDPRYVQQAPFRQYDNYGDHGDYVELDVRPPLPPPVSGRQRYDQRGPPHYDDYY